MLTGKQRGEQIFNVEVSQHTHVHSFSLKVAHFLFLVHMQKTSHTLIILSYHTYTDKKQKSQQMFNLGLNSEMKII